MKKKYLHFEQFYIQPDKFAFINMIIHQSLQ
jgi:hypothetical protein